MKYQAIKLPQGANNLQLAKADKGSWIISYHVEGERKYQYVLLTNEKQFVSIKAIHFTDVNKTDYSLSAVKEEIDKYISDCIEMDVISPVLVIVSIE